MCPVATQVMVITGGSRGIGKSTALLAARQGYRVCICYENKASLADNLVEEIKSKGGEALAVQADVSVPEEIKHIFNIVDEKLGPLTALVNNAGISGDREKLANLDVSSIREVGHRWYYEDTVNFQKNSNHRALDDIRDSIEELRYYRKTNFKC